MELTSSSPCFPAGRRRTGTTRGANPSNFIPTSPVLPQGSCEEGNYLESNSLFAFSIAADKAAMEIKNKTNSRYIITFLLLISIPLYPGSVVPEGDG